MQLPPIRRLTIQDYVSQQAWIGPLLQNINNFMDATYLLFNKNLNLADNSTGAVIPVTLTATPTSKKPFNVPWVKTGTPLTVMIGNIQQRSAAQNNSLTTSGTVLTSAVSLEWQYLPKASGNQISITNLVGVVPTGTLPIILQLVVSTG